MGGTFIKYKKMKKLTTMKIFITIFILILGLFICPANAQDFMNYDSLAFALKDYGYIEYTIPIRSSYDTLLQDYADSIFLFVYVDSLELDDQIALDFDFYKPVTNVWFTQVDCIDKTGTIINNGCIILHIIPPIVRYIWK